MSTSKTMFVPVWRVQMGAHKFKHTDIYLSYIKDGWRVVGMVINKESGRIEAKMEHVAGPSVLATTARNGEGND